MRLVKIIVVSVLAIFCFGNGGSLMADNQPGSFSVTPFIGGYLFEGNQDLDDGFTAGLGVGYNLDEHWGTEAVFNYIDSGSKAGTGDVDGFLYRIDGLYHFLVRPKLIPYLAAGIGGLTLAPDRGNSNTQAIVNFGGGLKYFFAENFAARGDLRYIKSFDGPNNLAFTFGITYNFGGKKAVAAVPPPKDSDGDGVYDHLDKCPNTPAGVKVDASGCPLDTDGDGVYDNLDQCPGTRAGVKVDETGCPPDSDGDGVPDYLDQCPGTRPGVKVDETGCPLDSDGDGVPDYLDQCPGTRPGVKVDETGCPPDSDGDGVPDYLDQCPRTPKGARVNEKGCWVLKGVQFELNKWNVKPQYYPVLDEALYVLRQNSSMRVEIQGHTDNTGDKDYNQMLSEKRAKAVMDYFMREGIAAGRLSAEGYGPSRPIASNATREGRSKNRRVQLKPIY
ncbi:MAG: OmpA family protein [Deltaproteobacteria bacterium]|nr:MAG: OmpA family protein [Deltaproteobacteria bacterium]